MTTLTRANSEWSKRAPDERFSSLADIHKAAQSYRTGAMVAEIKANALRVAADGSDLMLVGPSGKKADMTNWSFGQVSQIAKAPAAYLRQLPATIAADCINDGLANSDDDRTLNMLVNQRSKGQLQARAITSDKYARIWNTDLTSRLIELEQRGPWQPAPAAFDGSRGLYLGDRDMFAFLVDNERRIFEKGPGGGLSRGFFVWNSEVGAASFGISTFLYEYVCGNHRVWGAQDVSEMRVIHIGKEQGSKAFTTMQVELKKYAETTSADDEAKVLAARKYQIAATKDELLDAVFQLKAPGLGRAIAAQAYELAEKRVDWYGSPRTAWGFAGGVTEIARDMPNADDRHQLNLAAGKVMAMAF